MHQLISRRVEFALALALLLPIACASAPRKNSPDLEVSFEERLLATIPEEDADWQNQLTFSPDGRSFVYIVQKPNKDGSKYFVLTPKGKGPEVSRVGAVVGMCGMENSGTTLFSLDSRRLAYAVEMKENADRAVVIDGVMSPLHRWTGDPVFSRDGRRVAYEVDDLDKNFIILDGRPIGREFGAAGHPVFSASGRLAFQARDFGPATADGKKPTRAAFIVLDGRKLKEFDHVSWPVFHPAGQEVAYGAQRGDKEFIVSGEREGPRFDWVGEPVFSPDGARLAHPAMSGDRCFIVADGRRMDLDFEAVDHPFFSPDGSRLAYIASRQASAKMIENVPPIMEKQCVVVDREIGEDFDFIWQPRFTPDGKTVVYEAKLGDKWFIVVGRKRVGTEHPNARLPVVGSDATQLAYVATDDEGMEFVVCGNQKSGPFDEIEALAFSPDGKKLAFGARKGREIWWKVVGLK